MANQELINEYIKEMCSTCKAICDKGIVLIKINNETIARCVDYEKDKSKLKGYKKPLERTAKMERTVMGLSGCDWN